MGHDKWMGLALEYAREAAARDEVPVGAVVVRENQAIAGAGNACKAGSDPTMHAELLAMRQALGVLKAQTLGGCALYVTLEPCPLCAGAILLLRPLLVVFGAADPRAGCCGSVYRLTEDAALGLGTVPAYGGVLAGECAGLLQNFFAKRRIP